MQPVLCSTRIRNKRKGVSPKCSHCPRQNICYQLSIERFKRKVFRFFGVFAMAVLIVGFVLNNFDVIPSKAQSDETTDTVLTEAVDLGTTSSRVRTNVHAERIDIPEEETVSEDTAAISTEVLPESEKPLNETEPIDNLDQLVSDQTALAEIKAKIDRTQSETAIPEEEEQEMPEETEPVQTEAYSEGGQSYSDYELQLVARLIAIEAGNQPYDGKVAVGATVVNRKKNSGFPDTIEGVIYDSGQFASLVYSWETVQSDFPDCIDAARDALNGIDPTREHLNGLGNLYFYNPDHCSDYQNAVRANISVTYRIGDHVFYAVWD